MEEYPDSLVVSKNDWREYAGTPAIEWKKPCSGSQYVLNGLHVVVTFFASDESDLGI